MPYMTIYKTKDGKWHAPDCEDVTPDTYEEAHRIGGPDNMKQPHPEAQCEKCLKLPVKSEEK